MVSPETDQHSPRRNDARATHGVGHVPGPFALSARAGGACQGGPRRSTV